MPRRSNRQATRYLFVSAYRSDCSTTTVRKLDPTSRATAAEVEAPLQDVRFIVNNTRTVALVGRKSSKGSKGMLVLLYTFQSLKFIKVLTKLPYVDRIAAVHLHSDGLMFLLGTEGRTSAGSFTLDLSTAELVKIQDLPCQLAYASAISLNSSMIVAFGVSQGCNLCFSYSVNTGQWTSVSLEIDRLLRNFGLFIQNSSVVVMSAFSDCTAKLVLTPAKAGEEVTLRQKSYALLSTTCSPFKSSSSSCLVNDLYFYINDRGETALLNASAVLVEATKTGVLWIYSQVVGKGLGKLNTDVMRLALQYLG
jgi:hypothetical protein